MSDEISGTLDTLNECGYKNVLIGKNVGSLMALVGDRFRVTDNCGFVVT